jgi:hypothetical protein
MDWTTISSLATAGGTLVLAVATFSSVRSANRSARVAERSLLVGLRPILITSREDDPPERLRFGDNQVLTVPGHGGAVQVANGNVYMAIALRNGGSGIAVIHGWYAAVRDRASEDPVPIEDFRRQQLDLFIPPGETGYWYGAIREADDPSYDQVRAAASRRERVLIDILYGDHEGGQRTISRFAVSDWPEVEGERAQVLRHWNVDSHDPR